MVWTDPRTGEKFVNEAVALSLGYDKPVELNLNKVSPSYGQPTNSQVGSQIWMDAGYRGPEPTLSQKLALTGGGSAEYARDWISLNSSTVQYAKDQNYPTPSQNSVEIYYQNDQVKKGEQTPAQAAQNLGSDFDISSLYPVLIGAGVLVLAVTLLGRK